MPRRPQILLISELFPPAVGGSAVLFENVYTRISDYETVVFTEPPPGPARDPGRFRFEHGALRTPHWGILNPGGFRHHCRTASRIRKISRNFPVIAHCGRALPEGVAGSLSRALGGPRTICWAHGEDIGTARTSRELTFLMTRIYKAAEALFANSASTARSLQSLGVAEERIAIVHPGVDAARFHPERSGKAIRERYAPHGETLILTVGRLQRRKGHDLVLRTLQQMGEQSRGISYLIVGTGLEETNLRATVRVAGLADRVHFIGQVSDQDLPSYYAACDIFLLPNRLDGTDVEGFGIVFLEAQAMSRPVIGGRSGGVPEAIAEGETGFLVSGTDPEELAEVLGRLAASPELRAQLGQAGRARVMQHFTWERAAQAVAGVHGRIADA